MLSAILPWPARGERKAAVADARQLAAEAGVKAGQARKLSGELRRLREKNHVSEALDLLATRRAREQR